MEPKLGKVIYSFTIYEKVKRATILPDSEEDPILMVSLDNNNNKGGIYYESLILESILALVSYYLKSFSDRKDLTFHDGGDSHNGTTISSSGSSKL